MVEERWEVSDCAGDNKEELCVFVQTPASILKPRKEADQYSLAHPESSFALELSSNLVGFSSRQKVFCDGESVMIADRF